MFRKNTDSTRRLKSGGGTAIALSNDTDKYLLSDLHLDISIESSGEEDESKLGFYWYAKSITSK